MKEARKRPIFIIGAHKSGSSFVRSLLDGHPELCVIPVEAHYFEHANARINYAFRAQESVASKDFYESAYAMLTEYATEDNPYSDFSDRDAVNLEAFEAHKGKIASDNDTDQFNNFMTALAACFGLESEGRRFVEKSIEQAEFVSRLREMFPEAQFIHIIRNPYDNLASFRRYRQQQLGGEYPRIDKMVQSLENHYHYTLQNMNADNYYTFKYEDLKDNTEKEIRKIADFLGLDWNDCLLKTTSLGREWGGNTSKSAKDDDVQVIEGVTDLEIYYVNKFFPEIVEKFGYEKQDPQGKPKKRLPQEPLGTFIKNRTIKSSL